RDLYALVLDGLLAHDLEPKQLVEAFGALERADGDAEMVNDCHGPIAELQNCRIETLRLSLPTIRQFRNSAILPAHALAFHLSRQLFHQRVRIAAVEELA